MIINTRMQTKILLNMSLTLMLINGAMYKSQWLTNHQKPALQPVSANQELELKQTETVPSLLTSNVSYTVQSQRLSVDTYIVAATWTHFSQTRKGIVKFKTFISKTIFQKNHSLIIFIMFYVCFIILHINKW